MENNLKVRVLEVEAGKPIVVLNESEASERSLFLNDRIKLSHNGNETVAIADLSKKVPKGEIYLFEETQKALGVGEGGKVKIDPVVKPNSVGYIRKKICGEKLTEGEIEEIIRDTVDMLLTDPELTAFNIAIAMTKFSLEEAEYLTRSMLNTGDTIDIENALDKHCIGGIPGNRTTPLLVSIIAAAGFKIPKTSSRAISSPAGTADTMEVLASVRHSLSEIKEIVDETNGCIALGGSVNIAPADDEFIRVRGSLGLDPLELVLSSVMAKKKAVGSDTVLIDIPVGREAKITSEEEAEKVANCFGELGKRLDMEVLTFISDGESPIGNGIGPALEARDVMQILESGGKKGPKDLKEKVLKMANILLDKVGYEGDAEEILETGRAYEKMKEIIKAQGGHTFRAGEIEIGRYKEEIRSKEEGEIKGIHNSLVNEIARTAGCPKDKRAGIYLPKTPGESVKKGEELFTIYSENKSRLTKAAEKAEEKKVFEIESSQE